MMVTLVLPFFYTQHPLLKSKFIRNKKQEKKIYYHKIKLFTEPDPKLTKMLELLHGNFKITRSNMFNNLVEKVDNLHEKMGILGREMVTIKIAK